jgi:hypothetical protein
MKIIFALFAVMLAGTAFVGDSGNRCKLQGTWIWRQLRITPNYGSTQVWSYPIKTPTSAGGQNCHSVSSSSFVL